MGGQATVLALLDKDLEVGDGIFFIGKKGIQLGGGAKLEPGDPVCIFAFGAVVINRILHCVVNKAEVTAEFISGSRWHKRKGLVCGCVRFVQWHQGDRDCRTVLDHCC